MPLAPPRDVRTPSPLPQARVSFAKDTDQARVTRASPNTSVRPEIQPVAGTPAHSPLHSILRQ
jgi:hypothetical protein